MGSGAQCRFEYGRSAAPGRRRTTGRRAAPVLLCKRAATGRGVCGAGMDDVIILGAGIVGVATGIHLLRRGRSVTLIDRREPGHETSFGNAGIIQREGVRPHPFPRDLATLLQVGLHLSVAARYAPLALPKLAPPLLRYWWESSPEHYRRVV